MFVAGVARPRTRFDGKLHIWLIVEYDEARRGPSQRPSTLVTKPIARIDLNEVKKREK